MLQRFRSLRVLFTYKKRCKEAPGKVFREWLPGSKHTTMEQMVSVRERETEKERGEIGHGEKPNNTQNN